MKFVSLSSVGVDLTSNLNDILYRKGDYDDTLSLSNAPRANLVQPTK